MKKTAVVLSVLLVLVLFAAMALGSGSSSGSKNKGSDSAVSVTTDNTESKDNAGSAEKSEGKTEDSAQPPGKTAEKESYETGEGTVKVYTDSIGSVWAQISVPVTNTGDVNLYLSSGTMDLEDPDGHLVDSITYVSAYPTVLKPGETAWYYDETTLDEGASSELRVVPHVDVKAAKVDCIRFEVSDLAISDDTYGGIKVTGRVENTTEEDESLVYVVVFFYGPDDVLLGQAYTILTDDLKAGDKIGFSCSTFSSYDQYVTANVSRYEVYSYPTQIQF
ncbi:MAG: FxLYD domain-containing protein [Oscillospiraceae bacterium]|nr:FxLYD domain-containing protein [Oscillospiraceae bacterium]